MCAKQRLIARATIARRDESHCSTAGGLEPISAPSASGDPFANALRTNTWRKEADPDGQHSRSLVRGGCFEPVVAGRQGTDRGTHAADRPQPPGSVARRRTYASVAGVVGAAGGGVGHAGRRPEGAAVSARRLHADARRPGRARPAPPRIRRRRRDRAAAAVAADGPAGVTERAARAAGRPGDPGRCARPGPPVHRRVESR